MRARDGARCRLCQSSRTLEVHHIYRWYDFPALRFVLDNGITLCHRCHKFVTGREYDFADVLAELAKRNEKNKSN